MLIASARRVEFLASFQETKPVPSNEQGFGFPVLGDVLYFAVTIVDRGEHGK